MHTPFDDFILELDSKIFDAIRAQNKDANFSRNAFLLQQLGLLRVSYVSLVEAAEAITTRNELWAKSGKTDISREEAVLEQPESSHRVFLNYYSFINVLCQLSRALIKHFGASSPIPSFERIRFYRNKIVEHWDEYTSNLARSGFGFTKGKAAIPAIEGVHVGADRKVVLSDLKNSFTALGVQFVWDNYTNLLGLQHEYSNAVFIALEQIPNGLTAKAKDSTDLAKVVHQLMELGFPTPVVSLETYSVELLTYLKSL